MKKGILLLLLFGSVCANAQSLKDALFGGKLKNEPGSVIRKGDDLSSKIDTATKTTTDSTAKSTVSAPTNSTKNPVVQTNTPDVMSTDTTVVTTTTANNNVPTENIARPKDNNALWKEFMASVINSLKTEVLPSKKIKKESYSVSVSYVIGTDGQVTINEVTADPENQFLIQQIKDRLNVDTPKLNPVLSSNGTPRKVTKRYNFTLDKE